MSGNTETTSNSMKFTPMPMSMLWAQLMPDKPADSPDSSYTSVEDSDNSFGETVAKKTSAVRKKKHTHQSSTPKVSSTNHYKGFISEKKALPNDSNKENQTNQSMSHNWKYPNKDTSKFGNGKCPQTVNSHVFSKPSNSDINTRNPMTPLGEKPKDLHKQTPEQSKIPASNQKTRAVTPKVSHQKSGIRRFTPGSGRHSSRKTPQKISIPPTNKESVRCLFPDSLTKEESSCPSTLAQPVPETPMNRQPMPAVYAATPSYPQGTIRNQSSKIHLKTTVVKGKNYIYLRKLGVGGSSEVYKALEVSTSNEYAIKCVNLGNDVELARGYINEVRLLRELQHSDRVIRLYDYVLDRENGFLRLVLEVGETDLSSFLRSRGGGLQPAPLLYYWLEMLDAVHHIHEHGVVHADLKPANFLLVCGRLKLIDFGIASSISSDATSVVRAQATGTYSYISPEALMGGAGGYGVAGARGHVPIKISFRSDVWSLGCILYSMVYGRTPFSHIPNLAKLAAILDPNHRIDYPPADHLPRSLISALKWCLSYNVRSRPTVRQLLAIPYLQHPACTCDVAAATRSAHVQLARDEHVQDSLPGNSHTPR